MSAEKTGAMPDISLEEIEEALEILHKARAKLGGPNPIAVPGNSCISSGRVFGWIQVKFDC